MLRGDLIFSGMHKLGYGDKLIHIIKAADTKLHTLILNLKRESCASSPGVSIHHTVIHYCD